MVAITEDRLRFIAASSCLPLVTDVGVWYLTIERYASDIMACADPRRTGFMVLQLTGADPAGGPGPPLSENLGIDFYSGFREKSRYTLL